jgi:arylsulfatase A-like enzyme
VTSKNCAVLIWLLAALVAAHAASAAGQGPKPAPPNIVFILADDLGWTDLGCFGSRYYETPHLDRLCAEGMKFTHAYANGPNCAPTRASLMAGTYTPRHGVTQVGERPRGRPEDRKLREEPSRTDLRLEEFTLAEALRAGGYAAAHIGKWHLGAGPTGPESQGFDLNIAGDRAGSPPGYFAPYSKPLAGIGRGEKGEFLPERLTDEAVRFMEQNRARPFFLYLSHFSVHVPIQAKPELIAKYEAKPPAGGHSNPRYAAMVHSLDESVGRVLAALDRLGLRERTLVVFTSDNGGWSGATSNQPLRGFKGMLYEGGIRVPLIARWPGRVRPGSVSETPVISLDWYPTLLDAAGLKPAPGQTLDGESLVPVLRDGRAGETRSLYWHFPHYLEAGPNVPGPWRTTPAGAIRRGDYKLVEFFEDGRRELYDLKNDPSESRDLAPEQPETVRKLHDDLQRWRQQVGARIPQPQASAARD